MIILSSEFANNGIIPDKYTADGADVNPPLEISEIPENAKSMVLIVDDPDAQKAVGKIWDHWIIFNIPATNRIEENSVPGTQGKNSYGRGNYGGPSPPAGSGVHHYHFKLYALDSELSLDSNATKTDVENAMKDHILAQTELIGTYSKG